MDWIEKIFLYQENTPMIFTNFYFWGFFAVVMAIYSVIYRQKAVRNAFLFFVSLFFYYKSSGLFFVLLVFSTISDYLLGFGIHRSRKKGMRLSLLVLSITINLFLLSYFKFAYFFTDTCNLIFQTDIEVFNHFSYWCNTLTGSHFTVDKILLPVGISFFTFQTISYSVDVYQGKIKPVRNILDFGFYVSFFPQLVAGPIVRASEFIPQLYKEYKISKDEFGLALFWILKGLMKKIFIADYLAVNFIDRIFENPLLFTGFENLMALYGYSLQVYCDFAGYTDIAIGIAMLMGFRLPVNFNSPYKSRSVGDFWRRWHMSLSTWLKDYLYIPLGGSRSSSFLTYFSIPLGMFAVMYFGEKEWWLPIFVTCVVAFPIYFFLSRKFPKFKVDMNTNMNLMITMLLGGLWHGASWLFVIWGGLNGLGIIVYKQWRKISPWEKRKGILATGWKIFITFNFITFTRIWFRSPSMDTANSLMGQIWNSFNLLSIPEVFVHYAYVFVVMAIGMILHWLPDGWKEGYRDAFIRLPIVVKGVVSVIIVFVVYQHMSAGMHPFIYFQF